MPVRTLLITVNSVLYLSDVIPHFEDASLPVGAFILVLATLAGELCRQRQMNSVDCRGIINNLGIIQKIIIYLTEDIEIFQFA